MARTVKPKPKGRGRITTLACMKGRRKCPSYAKGAYARAAANLVGSVTTRPRMGVRLALKDKTKRVAMRRKTAKRVDALVEALTGRKRNAQLRALAQRLGQETAVRPNPSATSDLAQSNALARARASALMDNMASVTNSIQQPLQEIAPDNKGAPGVPSSMPTTGAEMSAPAMPAAAPSMSHTIGEEDRNSNATPSGEENVVDVPAARSVRELLDYALDAGITPADLEATLVNYIQKLGRLSPVLPRILNILEEQFGTIIAPVATKWVEAMEKQNAVPESMQAEMVRRILPYLRESDMEAREVLNAYRQDIVLFSVLLYILVIKRSRQSMSADNGVNRALEFGDTREQEDTTADATQDFRPPPYTPARTAVDVPEDTVGSPTGKAALEEAGVRVRSTFASSDLTPFAIWSKSNLSKRGWIPYGRPFLAYNYPNTTFFTRITHPGRKHPATGRPMYAVASVSQVDTDGNEIPLENRRWGLALAYGPATPPDSAQSFQSARGEGLVGGASITTPSAVPNVGFGPGYRGSDPASGATAAAAMLAQNAPAAVKFMDVRTHKQQLDYADAVDRTYASLQLLDHTTRGEQNDYYATNKVSGMLAPSFPAYIPNAVVESTQIQSMQMRPDDVDVDALANRAYPYADPIAVKRAMTRNAAFQSGIDAQTIVSFIQLVQNDQTTQPAEKEHIIAVLKRDGLSGARARAVHDEVLKRFFQNIYGRGESGYQTTFLAGAFNTTHYDGARDGIVDRNERLKALYYGDNPTLFAAPFATRLKQAADIQAATVPTAGDHEAAASAARAAEARLQVQLNDRFLTNDVVAAVGLANLTGVAQATTLHEEIAPGVPGGRTSAQQTLQQQIAGTERGTQYSRAALQEVPGYIAEYVALANARRCAMLNNIGAR